MKVLDVFAGVGGLSWGFAQAGFEVVGGIDVWGKALKVFKKVHPEARVIEADVTTLSSNDLIREFKNVDVVVGGPPCQAFSTIGKRALDDPRAKLVKEFIKVVKIFKPQVFVFENVKGFVSFAKGKLLKELLDKFEELGYYVDYGLLNAADFGAPQNRERFIVVGSLSKPIKLPRGNFVKREFPWTFREATSDLPPVKAGERVTNYLTLPQNELQMFYRLKSKKLTLHEAPKYSEKLLNMIKFIPEGMSAHDPEVFEKIPPEYRPTSGYKNTYKRIRWDEPAPTITRNFSVPSSTNCIHPKQDRALTPREAARIQTFPDDYPFDGTRSDIRLMIGNAVPLFLSFGLAVSLAVQLNVSLSFSDYGKAVAELINIQKIKEVSKKGKFLRNSELREKRCQKQLFVGLKNTEVHFHGKV